MLCSCCINIRHWFLLTLRRVNIWDRTSSCIHRYTTSVFQVTDASSVENVLGGLCIDTQHWFHDVSEVTHHRRSALWFKCSKCCRVQFLLLLATAEQYPTLTRRFFAFLCHLHNMSRSILSLVWPIGEAKTCLPTASHPSDT